MGENSVDSSSSLTAGDYDGVKRKTDNDSKGSFSFNNRDNGTMELTTLDNGLNELNVIPSTLDNGSNEVNVNPSTLGNGFDEVNVIPSTLDNGLNEVYRLTLRELDYELSALVDGVCVFR